MLVVHATTESWDDPFVYPATQERRTTHLFADYDAFEAEDAYREELEEQGHHVLVVWSEEIA